MAQSGKGTTITFGTSAWSLTLKSLDEGESSKAHQDVTTLSSTKVLTQPGDVTDPGEMKIEYFFDQSAASFPAETSAAETITVTRPLKTGEATPGTLAGTGYVTKVKRPVHVINQIMMGELTIRWSGATGPTNTAGSA